MTNGCNLIFHSSKHCSRTFISYLRSSCIFFVYFWNRHKTSSLECRLNKSQSARLSEWRRWSSNVNASWQQTVSLSVLAFCPCEGWNYFSSIIILLTSKKSRWPWTWTNFVEHSSFLVTKFLFNPLTAIISRLYWRAKYCCMWSYFAINFQFIPQNLHKFSSEFLVEKSLG